MVQKRVPERTLQACLRTRSNTCTKQLRSMVGLGPAAATSRFPSTPAAHPAANTTGRVRRTGQNEREHSRGPRPPTSHPSTTQHPFSCQSVCQWRIPSGLVRAVGKYHTIRQASRAVPIAAKKVTAGSIPKSPGNPVPQSIGRVFEFGGIVSEPEGPCTSNAPAGSDDGKVPRARAGHRREEVRR